MALVEENTKRQNNQGTDTEEEDKMEKLAETSECDIRSSIGQVFTRAHAKGTKGYNAYSNCKGWEEKREFRKRWCMGKFKDYPHSKNQSKAWSFVDETPWILHDLRSHRPALRRMGMGSSCAGCKKCGCEVQHDGGHMGQD